MLKRRPEIRQKMMSGENDINVDIQALSFGDVTIVGIPGEVYLEYGLEIKKRSPYKHTFVSELANQESIGYIPTPEAFKEGGYEPTSALCTPEAGQKLVKVSISLLGRLHSQKT